MLSISSPALRGIVQLANICLNSTFRIFTCIQNANIADTAYVNLNVDLTCNFLSPMKWLLFSLFNHYLGLSPRIQPRIVIFFPLFHLKNISKQQKDLGLVEGFGAYPFHSKSTLACLYGRFNPLKLIYIIKCLEIFFFQSFVRIDQDFVCLCIFDQAGTK